MQMINLVFVRNSCASTLKSLKAARAEQFENVGHNNYVLSGIVSGTYDYALPSDRASKFKAETQALRADWEAFRLAEAARISTTVRVKWRADSGEALGDFFKRAVSARNELTQQNVGSLIVDASRAHFSENKTALISLLERQHSLEKRLLSWLQARF